MKQSVAIENFLKTIYLFQYSKGMEPKAGDIARALGITNAAATDMSKKLAMKQLIQYEKYHTVKLTDTGKKLALNVIRKHRLWETFLYQTFKLTLAEIHREAELLEHQTSDFLAGKIESFLGKPAFDPHGDPIPDIYGEILKSKDIFPLSEAEPDQVYQVARLFSSDDDFFLFCQMNGIKIQHIIRVENQYVKNKMTEITIDENRLLLNEEFAKMIYVRNTKN